MNKQNRMPRLGETWVYLISYSMYMVTDTSQLDMGLVTIRRSIGTTLADAVKYELADMLNPSLWEPPAISPLDEGECV